MMPYLDAAADDEMSRRCQLPLTPMMLPTFSLARYASATALFTPLTLRYADVLMMPPIELMLMPPADAMPLPLIAMPMSLLPLRYAARYFRLAPLPIIFHLLRR